jgi:hypothetical protein
MKAVKHNIESLLKIVEKRYANFKQKGLAGLDESFSGAWWSRVDLEAARKMLTGKERGTLSIGQKFKSGDRQNPKYNAIKQHFETCEIYRRKWKPLVKSSSSGTISSILSSLRLKRAYDSQFNKCKDFSLWSIALLWLRRKLKTATSIRF